MIVLLCICILSLVTWNYLRKARQESVKNYERVNDSVCVDVSMRETDSNSGENRMAVPLTRNKKDSIMIDNTDGIYDNHSGVIGSSTNGSIATSTGTSTTSVIRLQGQASPRIAAGTTGRTAGVGTAYADGTLSSIQHLGAARAMIDGNAMNKYVKML